MADAIWQACTGDAASIIGRMRAFGIEEIAIPEERALAAKLYRERMGNQSPEPRRQLDYGRPGRAYDRDGRFVKHRRR